MFILFPPADESALETKLETIRAEITKLGGDVEATTRMGRNMFARRLQKKESGFYVLITFSLDPAQVTTLRERLRLNEAVFRAQIVLTPPGPPPGERPQPVEKPATVA